MSHATALWWFARRLRAAIEVDCDARVLRRGVDAAHYAGVLLKVAQRRSFSPYVAATLIEPVTRLERRIRTMLAKRQPASMLRSIALTGLALALVACVTSIEPPPIMPLSSADTGAETLGAVDKIVSGGNSNAPFRIVLNEDGTRTIEGAVLILHVSHDRPLRGASEPPGGWVMEGGVQFEFERASASASRATAAHTSDGQMTLTLEDAVVVVQPQ